MAETPRAPPPARPPPPIPLPDTPPRPESPPSTPGEDYHTPTPSLDEAREETPPWQQQETNGRAAAKSPSPTLSPVRLPSQHRLLPPNSPTGNGEEAAATGQPQAPGRRPQLRLAPGLVRTPSQGSVAKSPSPSPSPSPPSPLTPAAPPVPTTNSKSVQSTPKRTESWKPPATGISVQFDPVEEAVTSPLQLGKARLDSHRARTPAAAANGAASNTVPREVAAVAAVGERRTLSVALRLATALLSLASFALIASAKTSGWDGDHFDRYVQYRYALAVNVIVCVYSIAQALGEIRRLVAARFAYRSMSSYYFSLFLDQVLAYLLMSASSAAASRNNLWVSSFGQDAFNKKITSAMWLSFLGFIALAASSLISTANLFSMV
ncbi:CASP-like protein 4U1 [Lolium rigidum]|uniref:CASP-like protein 4U1 n=1 Tax=Lolium rigidum TaxID=89674 RepID=UPI001F5D6E05|nr:CASP-like protein 4U1 [Lolium rigidum]